MGFSPHRKIASLVPRASGRIPTQDLGEVALTIPTTGYEDMVVNDCSSQSTSWRWKVAGVGCVDVCVVGGRFRLPGVLGPVLLQGLGFEGNPLRYKGVK